MLQKLKDALFSKGKAYRVMVAVAVIAVFAALSAGFAIAADDSARSGGGQEQEAAENSDSGSSAEDSTSAISPSDAWTEIQQKELGGEAADEDDATAVKSEASRGSGNSGDSAEGASGGDGEATDDPDDSTVEDLDAEINDLGDDNYIDLQQTPESSTLVDTDISELVQAPASLQQTPVQVRGEVVGDAIKADMDGTKYWLTFDSIDDKNEGSISVLVDSSVIGLIDTYGAYNKTGTILRVKGTFYVACPSHEGIMDIHADSVTVVEHGSTTQDEFDMDKLVPGLVLCVVGAALAVLYRILAERQR